MNQRATEKFMLLTACIGERLTDLTALVSDHLELASDKIGLDHVQALEEIDVLVAVALRLARSTAERG